MLIVCGDAVAMALIWSCDSFSPSTSRTNAGENIETLGYRNFAIGQNRFSSPMGSTSPQGLAGDAGE